MKTLLIISSMVCFLGFNGRSSSDVVAPVQGNKLCKTLVGMATNSFKGALDSVKQDSPEILKLSVTDVSYSCVVAHKASIVHRVQAKLLSKSLPLPFMPFQLKTPVSICIDALVFSDVEQDLAPDGRGFKLTDSPTSILTSLSICK